MRWGFSVFPPDQLSYYRSQSIKHYRQSLKKRPTASEAWVKLAEVKFDNQEIDQEMFLAIERAITYGPFEKTTYTKITGLGMLLWDESDDDLKSKVMKTIDVTLTNDPEWVIYRAIRSRWVPHLQPMLKTKSQRKLLKSMLEEYGE